TAVQPVVLPPKEQQRLHVTHDPTIDHLAEVDRVVAAVVHGRDAALEERQAVFENWRARRPECEALPPQRADLRLGPLREEPRYVLLVLAQKVQGEDAAIIEHAMCLRVLLDSGQ